jgi:hypothetical protein
MGLVVLPLAAPFPVQLSHSKGDATASPHQCPRTPTARPQQAPPKQVLSITYAIRSTNQDAPLVANLLATALASGGAGLNAALAAYGVPLTPSAALQPHPGVTPLVVPAAGTDSGVAYSGGDDGGAAGGLTPGGAAGVAIGVILGVAGLAAVGGAVTAAARRRRRQHKRETTFQKWEDAAKASLMGCPGVTATSDSAASFPEADRAAAAASAAAADAPGESIPCEHPPQMSEPAPGPTTTEPRIPHAPVPLRTGSAGLLPWSPPRPPPLCAPMSGTAEAVALAPVQAPGGAAAAGAAAWAVALGLHGVGGGGDGTGPDDTGSEASSYHTGVARSLASSAPSLSGASDAGSAPGTPRSAALALM